MATEYKLDSSESFYDLPPESFSIPIDDEQDWYDRHAIMQRKTSRKLILHHTSNSFSHRSELRFNRKTKPSVLHNAKISCVVSGSLGENKVGKLKLFRSRSEPKGNSASQVSEPGSPRVSCTGRVGLKSSDGKKTGFSRLFGSLLGSRKRQSRKKLSSTGG
ncbi:hypothetical protein F511_06753 [Dorcoceras hygrometricum]|uniref:Uncharacterized protein n=1 Tax=Dorcoceras hygrometricum TaxID=472368 RepID=A0A2Z7DD61_9LAMI|nr:hypothetical protein F511_06753 [Dorcoceras hygrometricum]